MKTFINKIKVSMLVLPAVIFGMASCDDPKEGEMFVEPTGERSEMSITSVLESEAFGGDFSLWIDLLKKTNYYNALRNGAATATVFCPTNEAMKKLFAERGISGIDELDIEYAKAIVQEHIIEGEKIFASDIDVYVNDANPQIPAINLFGDYLSLSYGRINYDVDDAERSTVPVGTDTLFINQQAAFQNVNADTCANGVIFIMSDVIKPKAETIYQTLKNDPAYSIFTEAIEAANFASEANKYQDTVYVQGGGYYIQKYSYTCFAVPDNVYQANGINGLNDLMNAVKQPDLDQQASIEQYVKYHFLTRDYTTAELWNFAGDDQMIAYSVLQRGKSLITNRTTDGKKVLNNDVVILRSDKDTRNGHIHKVGGVMPVFDPEPIQMKWDFLNSADLVNIVNAYGTSKGKANFFSSALGVDAADKYDFINETNMKNFGAPTSFTYNANETKASTSKFPAIGFWKDFKSTATAETSVYNAYLGSFLSLNLGFGGWVEFTSGSIIAGKYKVVLHYMADKGDMNMITGFLTNGTEVRMELDKGKQEGYQIWSKMLYKGTSFSRTEKYKTLSETLSEGIEFTETGTHTFRFTLRDAQAKNHGSYHISIDCLEFIPIGQ